MRTYLVGTSGSRVGVAVLSALAAALMLMSFAGLARAATFTVTKTQDTADGSCTPQDCSLREAVIAANETDGADVIKVPKGTYTLTIPRGGEVDSAGGDATVGDLDILDNMNNEARNEVEIQGAGARSTIIVGGAGLGDRIFDVPSTSFDAPELNPSNTVVEIDGVKITGGNTTSTGGGIRTTSVDFTLRESTVSGNQSNGDGGGIRNDGTASVVRSTISGNTTVGYGGGLFNNGTTEITNSTISSNSADIAGGGVGNFSFQGGPPPKAVQVNFSTLNANEAPLGANFGEASSDFQRDGVVFPQGVVTNAIFANSIISNARGGGQNCGVIVSSSGNNIDDDGSCTFTEDSDIQKDPRLGALNNNGGPTNTHALRDRSPAIDEAENTDVPTDQRGVRRPQDGDGRGRAVSDIGAFELNADTGDSDGGDDGACTITGTRRNDVLRGTERDDVICGLGGNDVIIGLGGDDVLQGDAGNDQIDAGPGADRVFGGNGDDAIDISDGTGRDLADGESGTDSCTSDPGDTVRSCRTT